MDFIVPGVTLWLVVVVVLTGHAFGRQRDDAEGPIEL